MNYTVWSHNFIYDENDSSICNVNLIEWRRLHDENETAERLFAKISVGEKTVYIALGTPITGELIPASTHTALFLPSWALGLLCCEGSGETVTVEWLDSESFPEATRIVLRPHDSAFFHADAKEELERALTSIGVLQLGTTIPVALSALGGFSVNVDVVGLEPTALVLMQGDEVVIEFEEALDAPAPPPSSPEPQPIVTPPPEVAVPPAGHQLGGISRPRGPDGRSWNPWRT
jgi:hypothetical protein